MLRQTAATFPALVLVGPRQVGKTSLLERVFPEYELVSLDVGANAEMAETRPAEFLRRHPPPLLLDEIQYAPAFFRHIKATVDSRRGENGLFVLTGSQNFQLMESVADSLAGRAAVMPLLGLSGDEWVPAVRAGLSWPDFVFRGGFPALWADLEATPDRDRWYQGYLATYLERDVRNLLAVGSLRDFERFLRASALRTGQLLNMSDLGRDVGISASTARKWLSVLQASNLIVLLEPYHRSLGKRLVKSPKLHFTDTGLAAFLMGMSSRQALWRSPYAGALWESYVIGQWLRWRDQFQPSASLWFWQDRGGHEVDLLIDLDGRLHAIECKLNETPRSGVPKAIAKLRAMYGADMVASVSVACTTEQPHDLAQGITARPGWTTWTLGGDV